MAGRQRGQTSVEWLAVMAVLATLAALAIAAGSPVAREIGCKATQLVGAVAGRQWSCGEPGERAQLPPCIVSQGDGELKASITVFSVKGGGKVKVIKQRRSDGKWLVTIIGGGELGAEFGSPGGHVGVDTGNGEVGAGEGVEGSAVAQGEYGATWIFDDEKGANDHIDIVRNKLRDAAIDAAVPILGSVGTSLFGEHRGIRDPDIEYVQGGVAGSVSAEAQGGAGGLQGGLDLGAAVGERWNHKDGSKTIYFQADAKGSGSAKLLAGLGIEGKAEGQIAVTYDRDGRPIAVDVIGKGTISGTAPEIPLSEDPRDFLRNVSFSAKGGGRGEVQLHLDLAGDPASRAAWDRFRANPLGGADDLARAFLDNGQAQVRTYEVSSEKVGIEADGKFGLEFGIEGGFEGSRADLVKAWDWDRQQGWRESATCKL